MINTPELETFVIPCFSKTPIGGLFPLRSNHQNGIAGRSEVSGNSNLMTELAGKLSKSCPVDLADTADRIAQSARSERNRQLVEAISPKVPVPKSHQPRCWNV